MSGVGGVGGWVRLGVKQGGGWVGGWNAVALGRGVVVT